MKKDLTTLFTGKYCIILSDTDSTNTYLSRVLNNISLPEGAVIRAKKQNEGRGQAGTYWESESGANLLVSFVFYPSMISSKEIFLLNKTFALGVYSFVSEWLGEKTSIKWPNDIYWENKKVSGLLIENSINGTSISHSILGVGVNINQIFFSSELSNPASFSTITGKKYNLEELFNSLCSHIEARYLKLKSGEWKSINDDYQSVLFGIGNWRLFESGNKRFKGLIKGVDENGKLLVQLANDEIRKFDLKEIRYMG